MSVQWYVVRTKRCPGKDGDGDGDETGGWVSVACEQGRHLDYVGVVVVIVQYLGSQSGIHRAEMLKC